MEQVHVMMFVCGSEYGLKIMHFLKALLFHRSTHIHFHFVADKDARPVLKQECVLLMAGRFQLRLTLTQLVAVRRWQKLRQPGGVGSGVPTYSIHQSQSRRSAPDSSGSGGCNLTTHVDRSR